MSNLSYERNDDNCDPTVPQPPFELVSDEPGSTWEPKPYRNYNAEYQARNNDNTARTPGTYQRIDDDGNPVTPASYVRTP